MKKLNTKTLSLLFITVFLIVTSILYQHQKESTIKEAQKRMDIFMKKWKALFDYVEIDQKNSIYKLQNSGVLDKDYFDPHILSFTFIARNVQDIYEKIETTNNITPYKYRLAATNPRNPVNKATKDEAAILEKFRNNMMDKYTKITTKDEKRYFTSYTPLDRTDGSCMRCHSDPKLAPKDLVDRYGSIAGFGEKIGNIRAMIILEIPIDEIEKEAFNNFILTLLVILFIFIGFFIIITLLIKKDAELEKINEFLEKTSNTDGLTNISNRRYFDNFIKQQWALMNRNKKPISLILCDIDFFKLYNDTYGHQSGDTCLISVAKAISKTLNRTNDLVARYGGEEFVIVLPEVDNEGAIHIAQLIRKSVSDLNIVHEKSSISSHLTISLGVSTVIPTKESSYETLIENADKLLYTAKKEGKNCVIS